MKQDSTIKINEEFQNPSELQHVVTLKVQQLLMSMLSHEYSC